MRNLVLTLVSIAGLLSGSLPAANLYMQVNLISDIPGMAATLDPQLRNPWGVSFSPTSPFWVSDQPGNVSTLYNSAFVKQALVVAVTSPTGQVFSNIAGNFMVGAAPATFIFDSLNGTIAGWNSGAGTAAVTEFASTDGAVFTGLASGSSGGNNFLYAADVRNGKIDVINSSWALATLAGTFTDPTLPAGFTPYNIQNVGGKLYVEYENRGGPGGIVDIFDTSGAFLQRFATNGPLNRPWGIVQAPAGFGGFGGDILVGNFGDGMINAFDPSGTFLGTLSSAGGPIVNSGLWSLEFRAPASGLNPDTLFISAGINNQADGLFAAIDPVPEPSTWALLTVGLGMLAILRRRARS